ncbi:MAG: hypothetical protein HND48_15885 [Chloroflexi bacterium]|nr:hypothetical protein [Chloroflexota bacterium]
MPNSVWNMADITLYCLEDGVKFAHAGIAGERRAIRFFAVRVDLERLLELDDRVIELARARAQWPEPINALMCIS